MLGFCITVVIDPGSTQPPSTAGRDRPVRVSYCRRLFRLNFRVNLARGPFVQRSMQLVEQLNWVTIERLGKHQFYSTALTTLMSFDVVRAGTATWALQADAR
jgi:hypothetical protein